MKTAFLQYAPEWENRQASRDKIQDIINCHSDKLQDCVLLAFCEMTLSGFTLNAESATSDDNDHSFFAEIAERHNINVIYCGVENGYNTFFCVDPSGKILAKYQKCHLFSYAGENKSYRPGENMPRTFRINSKGQELAISPAICFDLRFPYLFWNNAINTDMYIIPAAWPAARVEQWKALLKARAIENQSYVAGINRIGTEPGKSSPLQYAGGTMVFDPLGNCVMDAGSLEGIFTAEILPEFVQETRNRFPFIQERKK